MTFLWHEHLFWCIFLYPKCYSNAEQRTSVESRDYCENEPWPIYKHRLSEDWVPSLLSEAVEIIFKHMHRSVSVGMLYKGMMATTT